MHATLLAFVVLFAVASASSVKRVTGCNTVGMIDPEFCGSASEGSFCLTPQEANIPNNMLTVCGCKQDADCFTSPPFPFCITNAFNGGSCDSCVFTQDSTKTKAQDVTDHLFCRDRFPSVYLLNPPAGFVDTTERVPPTALAYFREVCNRSPTQGGACEGCHQASETNTPDITFPAYPGLSGIQLRGPKGSIHCRHVYPGPAPAARPICAYVQLFTDAGIMSLWTTLTVDLNIARNAMGVNQIETRTVNAWQGACIPCVLGGTPRHGLCSFSNPVAPICSLTGCAPCVGNADCQLATGTTQQACLADGTCTGGPNCQVDGSCIFCNNDNQCGGLDVGNNLVCNLATGICEDPAPCAENTDCAAGLNCMKDGTCRACTAGGKDCETNDGGTNNLQPWCNAGICEDCDMNSKCVGTSGANCQTNGRCLNCGNVVASPTCGGLDGGETPGQTVCNTNTQICETACNTNTFCANKGLPGDAFTKGANCQADGTCHTCTTDNDCGIKDGGSPSGQPTCDTVNGGVCFTPFTCADNPDCDAPGNVGGGQNCQTSLQCLSCIVTYTSSTCGTLDGGLNPGQINCDQTTRECVNSCNNNNQCANTQGANCMANGLCLNCRDDTDCGTNNAWGGDLGNERVCTANICTPACTGNQDCTATQNCMKDGRCVGCTSDADCGANDGPPPMGTNTICTLGRCVNPYVCQANGQDNNGCQQNTGRNNCQADGTCKTCASNADCGVLDGGQTPGQPRCQGDGTCGPCQVNGDCPAATPNCGKDGGCYACTAPGESCGAPDGGEVNDQPNCDTLTNICVNFCTADDQCLDDCQPHCNLERGCCVECTSDTHCPLVNWRGTEAGRTECSDDSLCVFPYTCETDSDCPAGTPACNYAEETCVECLTDTHCSDPYPACSTAEQQCVECLYDSHCASPTPACSTGEQNCVECTHDGHCSTGDVCGSDETCGPPDNNNPHYYNGASALHFLTATLVAIFATVLRF